MAVEIAKFNDFPDLKGFEDSNLKIKNANEAVSKLKQGLLDQEKKNADEKEKTRIREEARKRAEEIKKNRMSLSSLESRLEELVSKIGTQKAGYEFQNWFYDMIDFFEVQCRRPFNSNGRQIDDAISVSNTEYLVELKFQNNQADAKDIDSIHAKLRDKADNTMTIFIAMSGFSSVAISQAKIGRTMILLFDHNHIYLLLRGTISFSDLIDRVKRHAAQTGEPYLPISSFS